MIDSNLAAPQGFEPRYADPESAVLPLNEGAASVAAGNAADSTIHGFYWLLRTSVNMAWTARRVGETHMSGRIAGQNACALE